MGSAVPTTCLSTTSLLVQVPAEILHTIADNLRTPCLCSLRLTCRSIAQVLDNAFIKEFFTRKRFMFTKFSLETLRDISQSRMAPYLRQLEFGLEHFTDIKDAPSLNRNEKNRSIFKFKDAHSENTMWVYSGRRHQTLMAAFSGLRNLDTIMIRQRHSKTRFRDGQGSKWNSYGVITLSEETGLRSSELFPRGGEYDTANEIFISTMQALADAQITRVKGFEFSDMDVRGDVGGIYDHSFAIPPSMHASMVPVVQNIEKLHIIQRQTQLATETPWGNTHLMRFLGQAINLRHLRINGLHCKGKPSQRALIDWLKDSDRAEVLPKLQTLSLGHGYFYLDELIEIVKRFSETLVSLELWRITTCRQDVAEMDDAENDPPPLASPRILIHGPLRSSIWAGFFNQLLEIEGLSKLHHITLGNLSLARGEYFAGRPKRVSMDGSLEVEYDGLDWKRFINEKVLERNGPTSDSA